MKYSFRAVVPRILEMQTQQDQAAAMVTARQDLGVTGAGEWVEVPSDEGIDKAFEWKPGSTT